MRKKGLLSLFILMFSLCSIFGLVNLRTENDHIAQASLVGDNVWDGTYPTTKPSSADFYETENVVYIYTANGLAYFASQVNANAANNYNGKIIKLETNIDLNGKSGNLWIPIGNQQRKYFQGTFDGQGHYIYDMKTTGDCYNTGFFGSVGNGGIIKNLHIRNANINTGSNTSVANVGGVVGQIINNTSNVNPVPAVIENCSFSGSIQTRAKYTGGIVGVVATGTGSGFNNVCSKIENVFSSAEITVQTADSYVGGVVGYYAGREILNAGFDGSINAEQGGQLGGVVGFAASNIYSINLNNVYSTGAINAGNNSSIANVGGLIGRAATNVSGNTITNAYNSGAVTGGGYVAGLIGFVGSADGWTLQDCFNVGKINDGVNVQAIVAANGSNAKAEICVYQGSSDRLNLKNVYYPGQTNKLVLTNGNKYGTLKDFAGWAKSKGLYSNAREDENAEVSYDVWSAKWDFDNTWSISSMMNGSYPYLQSNATMFTSYQNNYQNNYARDTYYGTTMDNGLKGDGTELSPYLIYTAGDLSYVAEQVNAGNGNNAYYSLQNDIDLSNRTWIPIGKSGNAFTGVFDGNGHTIYGLNSSMQSALYELYGVFGMTSGNAVIKNLNVEEVRYLSSGDAGALIGHVFGATYLVNCTTTWANPVGTGYASLNVYFGEVNVKNSGSGLNGWTTTSTGTKTIKGYDVEIDFNGGKAISKTGELIAGEYHVLVDKTGKLINNQVATYQSQLLPLRSDHLTGFVQGDKTAATVTVREGYMLAGFARGTSDWPYSEATNTIGNCSDGNLIVVANYTETAPTLTLYYNAYENDNFSATEKTETKTVGYDSVLYEVWPEIFEKTRAGFVCEGVYQTYTSNTFTNKLTVAQAQMLVNDDMNFYLKWIGTTTTTHTFKVRVSYPGYFDSNIESYEDYAAMTNFAFDNAVKSINLESTEAGAVVSSRTEVDVDGKYKDYIFTFNTLASDLTTNSLSLDFEIADGYRVYNELISYIHLGQGSNTDYGDYGSLKTEGSINLNKDSGRNLPFRYLKWLNLQDDYTIEIALEREKYDFALVLNEDENTTDDDFYFAFGPGVLASSGINLNGTMPTASDVYVANDPMNEVSLLSEDAMERRTGGRTQYFDEEYFPFNFTDADNVIRYYRIYKETDGGTTKYTLVEGEFVNGAFTKKDMIVRLLEVRNGTNVSRKIEYFYGASFVFIAMTKNDGTKFVNITDLTDNENFGYSFMKDTTNPTQDNESKVLVSFTDFAKNDRDILIETKLTTISTDYRFQIDGKTVDETKELLNAATRPTFSTETYTYETVQQGSSQTMQFTLEPSRYYQFTGRSGAVVFGTDIIIEAHDFQNDAWSEVNYSTGWNNPAVNDNTHEVTWTYTGDIVAGKYRITIRLKPIYYSLNVNNNYDIGELETTASKYENISFDEEVTVTTVADNRAYYFNGWMVNGTFIEEVNGDRLTNTYTFFYKDLFEYCVSTG